MSANHESSFANRPVYICGAQSAVIRNSHEIFPHLVLSCRVGSDPDTTWLEAHPEGVLRDPDSTRTISPLLMRT